MDTMFGDLPRTRAVDPVATFAAAGAACARTAKRSSSRPAIRPCKTKTEQRVIVNSQQYVASIPADDRMIKMVDGNPVGVILLEQPWDCPHPTNPTGSL
jgi:hypothetical protein